MQHVEPVLADLGRAADVEDVWRALAQHFGWRGFGAIGYLIFDGGQLSRSVAFFQHGFPPGVISAFAERGYGRDSPAIRIAMATGEPQLAGKVAATHRFSRAELQHSEAIRAAGLSEALVLPLFGPLARAAVMLLSEPVSWAHHEVSDWTVLHMIAQRAHLRVLALLPSGQTPADLSQREMEVLNLIAQGKSNSVIAQLLALSIGTVDTYLRRVFEKLDVADRTSAAAKGVSLGLIRV